MQLATLCYVKNDGKTLMLYRNKKENDMHEGKWNGLGGKMEQGESPEECVIREIREESGLDIQNPQLHGVLTFPMFDGEQDWVVFLYTARTFEGELIESSEGTLEWIPDEELTDLNLWDGDEIFLEWIQQGRFFSGKFEYDGDELLRHSVVFH